MADNTFFDMKNIPPDERTENRRLAMIIGAAIACTIIVALLIGSRIQISIADNKIDRLNAKIEQLEKKNAALEEDIKAQTDLNLSLKNELAKTKLKLDTSNDQIEIYEDSIKEISGIANDIDKILHGEAVD